MATTFQQLLKEFPKSAAAAQAHYYIGKSAFEAKDYETAIAEMNKARQLNKDQYGSPAALRIMSSYFYLKQGDPLAFEVRPQAFRESDDPFARRNRPLLQSVHIEAIDIVAEH
jgi:tetratricopeptide (TPR) repeat protein